MNALFQRRRRLGLLFTAIFVGPLTTASALVAAESPAPPATFAQVVDQVQPKMVKIYGAGGLKGLQSYQSGFLISSKGHLLTVWSYVLDSDEIVVMLHDGRRFEAELVGADPRSEIAVLKIEGDDLPYFDLAQAPSVEAGTRVLAFSNLFGVATGDEPVSVLHGSVAVKAPLDARSGAFESLYRGPAYIVDAITNNPGAAGGALTTRDGALIGLLGKEMKNSLNHTWLNFALPIGELTASIDEILAGKMIPRSRDEEFKPEHPLELADLGLVLVPDVLDRTPPFIDYVRGGSPAAEAGLLPDDLIIFVNDRLVQSCQMLKDQFALIEQDAPLKLTVMRRQQLVEVTLHAAEK